jgi:phthiocerol/phenolphthiocerol synthesis type-I polyketide synthase B
MSEPETKPRGTSVAIVGIGCRFPGGVSDAESFWRFLSEGRDAITEIPPDRIDVRRYFDPRPATPGRMITRWGGFLDHIDEFDAEFFGISPREAERLDPAQRLLLEAAWEALEDAGQDVRKLDGARTGVFIGQWLNDFESRVFRDSEEVDFYMAQGSGRYASSGRISYVLGLRGPSLTIDTACSSSLVALHLAVRSIRSGESNMALAGGANIILQPHINIAYSQSRMMSADGRCKFGDASGDGYVRSEGVALVVLKSLDRAVADGDRIYAVIRGSAINNDGRSSGSMGTPSQIGQEELLRSAYRDAGLSGGDVDYVEAHGTGTRAGDPVEFGALATVLREGREPGRHAFVGSLKTNFGHTEAAAGVAGLIKIALALHHKAIPPSLHLNTPNPLIPWADLPLAVPRTLVFWPRHDGPHVAGVSGFGIAGTNAHVVLEEAPVEAAQPKIVPIRSASPLPLSAKSPEALRALATGIADLLESDAGPNLYDVCWTAATRRTSLEHRTAFIADGRTAMVNSLRRYADEGVAAAQCVVHSNVKPRICFVCPGQGAQSVGMARQLMANEPAFLAALERCDMAVRPHVDWSIIEQLSAEPDTAVYRLDEIGVIQPVLVAIAIAYADLLRSLGVEPAAVVGHSMGEVAAACIAGVLDLDQTMRIICRRSALMQRTSGQGAMALIDLSLEETMARLAGREERLSVAVSNSPRSSVISGDPDALQQVMAELERDNVFCRLVKVDVASHSPQMDQPARELVAELGKLATGEARIPIWSTVLGRRANGHEFGAAYWGRNLRQTVRFTDAVSGLLKDGLTIFVELGPHPILLHSVAETAHSLERDAVTIACGRREDDEQAALFVALGQLWIAGYPIEWDRLMPECGRVVSLPLYPWQRERHWAEAAEVAAPASRTRVASPRPDDEMCGWLYKLQWELSAVPICEAAAPKRGARWLIVSAGHAAGCTVAASLQAAGFAAVMVPFEQLESAIEQLARDWAPSSGILLLPSDGPDDLYSPIRALQAVLSVEWRLRPRLWVATRGGQSVSADPPERVSVDHAALWGAGRVIADEHPDLWGGLVDLDPEADLSADAALFVRHVLADDGEDQIAFRANRRYVLRLAPGKADYGSGTFAWRRDGTYLITGGLGDIGLHIARTLVANGVRRLVLMNRTQVPPREEWGRTTPDTALGRRVAAVRALEAEGVAVHIAAVDVSDESQLRSFIDRYTAEAWPPICGVVHAAGTFDNHFAASLSVAAFDAVVGPKLRGAQNLDRLLPDLDLFVLISSTGAFLAQAGQANYATANAGLDALAHDRRARGLPALSIAWGVWDNTGLVKGEAGQRNVTELARQGVHPFSPERGTRLFAWLCDCTKPHVAVLPINWDTFRRARAGRDYPIFRRALAGSPEVNAAEPELSVRLALAGLVERRQMLDRVVREAVGAVLKIAPSRVDPRKVLGAMGLTSLMAIELRNRLEGALKRPLSATLAWNYPTVEALVVQLASADRVATSVVASAKSQQPLSELTECIVEVAEISDEQAVAALRAASGGR